MSTGTAGTFRTRERKRRRGDVERPAGTTEKNDLGYIVGVLLGRGERVRLVDHLQGHAQALFLEQELEEVLGLDDAPVPGELPLPGARRTKKRRKRARLS